MDKLALDIYLLGDAAKLRPALDQARPVPLTSWEVKAGAPPAPLPWYAIVVACSLDELLPYAVDLAGEGIVAAPKLVLLGSPDDLGPDGLPANLLDIWPAGQGSALLRWRFDALLAGVRRAYDAWLWRTLLFAGMDNLPGMVWYKNRDGLHNLVNKAFCSTVRKTREDVKDREHNYIWDVPDDDPEAYNCDDSEAEVMGTRSQHVYDEALTTADGMKQLQVFKAPVFGLDGDVIGTVGYGNDVTDFTNMGRQMEILIENLPFAVVMCDRTFATIRVDQTFRTEFGLGDMCAQDFDYLSWRDALHVVSVSSSDDGMSTPFEVERPDGAHYYVLEEHEIIDSFGNLSGYYCVVRDVTREHNYQVEMMRLANTDDLTHVANRRAFYKYLQDHVHEPLCVFFFDLDNFKRVNDTVGHATGDDVLVGAARTIGECVPDGFVARVGGDEFACAVPRALTQEEAEALGTRIRGLFLSRVEHLDLGVDISYGIAITHGGDLSVDDILGYSDSMMYVAKKSHHLQG